MSEIVVVLRDRGTMAILSNLLKSEGYGVGGAFTLQEGQEKVGEDCRLVILGMDKPDDDDAFIGWMKENHAAVPVVLLADRKLSPQIERLDEVFQWLPLPLKVDALLAAVQKAVDFKVTAATQDTVNLNFQLESVTPIKGIVAQSPGMKAICDLIGRVAGTDVPVLIIGPKGTGKERIAKVVHDESRRKDAAFVTVDADDTNSFSGIEAAPDAFFQKVNGGTLFIQKPEGLPASLRDLFKNVLQTRGVSKPASAERIPVSIRVITGTGVDLDAWCTQGRFDPELLKLLRVIVLRLPPLKDRKQDLIPLLREFLRDAMPKEAVLPVITRDAVSALEGYPWPSNVQELHEAVQHMVQHMKNNVVDRQALPPLLQKTATPH